MGKLRNSQTDIGALTQWLGRKCRNHNPLEELQIASGAKVRVALPNTYLAKSVGNLSILEEDDGVLLYRVGSRVFEVTVREVPTEKHEGMKRLAVLR